MSDIVLCCRDAVGSPTSARPRLGIDEPASLVVYEGTLREAPPTWTHNLLTAKPLDLIGWLHGSLGSDMLRAISKHALDHPSRLVVSASDALQPVLLSTPWEVLEESQGDLQLLGNLRVVRSLPLKPRTGGADAIGVSLRVLVTWANPSTDISKLDEHLQWLSDLPKSTDSAVAVEVVELTDTTALQLAASKFLPNVVYHIGHAEQPGGDKVALRIGAKGNAQHLNGAAYAEVLRAISPRIVILNACSTMTGPSANPYLGMARECLGACDAVICMQTEIQVRAAKRFGQRLLWELADGTPLSVAVQLGRLSMVASREPGAEVSLFSKFVPVQLTREKAEPAFDVNADERTRLRIRKRLETELLQVSPLLSREADAAIDDLLANGTGVAVVTGPSESGKSTTIRGRIAKALRGTVPVPRILYLSARALPPVEPGHLVRQMLNALANHYGWLSLPLQELLRDHPEPDASRVVSDLATWLSLELKADRRTVVVLDDVPDDVAGDLVSRALGPVDAGLLVVVARAPVIPHVDVKPVRIGMMNESEAGSPEVLARTGGMPYFVAAIRRGQPLEGSHLDDRLVMLPAGMLHALRLTALSQLKLPRAWLGAIAGAIDGELAGLLEEANGLLSIPEIVRERVLSGFRGDEQALRMELLTFFEKEAKPKPSGPLERNRQMASKLEAMRQAIEPTRLTKDESWLERAFPFASDLHRVFLDDVGDAAAAKTMWEPYRDTAQDLDRFLESEADACYAEALAGVGQVSLADVVLDEVIAREEGDEVQVRSMLLQSNMVKRLGGSGAFDKREALLRRASTLAAKLIEEHREDAEVRDALRELLANIEHTLGNAYGFGESADVDEAGKHLKIAEDLFDELGDLRGHRVRNERIEMLRYNGKLSEEQRGAAMVLIERQLGELVTRSMREDAVRHLYELGRLETRPEAQAAWFRHAFERAAGSFSPLGQHAELHWKLAELSMGKDTEAEAAAIVKKLERWPEDSWTTRIRRNALRDLAECAFARGDTATGTERLQEALSLAGQLRQNGEGRRDAAARIALERKGVEHGLRR